MKNILSDIEKLKQASFDYNFEGMEKYRHVAPYVNAIENYS